MIELFCSLLSFGTHTCLRLAGLLCLVVFATFTGALTLLPHAIRHPNHPHHSTIHAKLTTNHDDQSSTLETMIDATESNISSQDSPLLAVAEELVLSIISHVSRNDLCTLARVSKKFHRLVTPLIWKDVELIDCRADTDPDTGHRDVTYGPATATHRGRNILAGTRLYSDEHDDMPLIKILLVLAT
jgi:hypothetical protein